MKDDSFTRDNNVVDNKDDEELTVVTREAQVAEQRAKQAEYDNSANQAEIEMELRKRGYNSIVEGQRDIEEKLVLARNTLEDAQREMALADAEKEKCIAAHRITKKLDEEANNKLKTARELEAHAMILEKNSDISLDILKAGVEYHNKNIYPVVQALINIKKVLYDWLEWLQIIENKTRSNGRISRLIEFIENQSDVFEAYFKKYEEKIPEDIQGIIDAEIKEDLNDEKEIANNLNMPLSEFRQRVEEVKQKLDEPLSENGQGN